MWTLITKQVIKIRFCIIWKITRERNKYKANTENIAALLGQLAALEEPEKI